MNLFLPRTVQSQVEIEEIVSVPNQIVSPQSNKPVTGCIQDIILGFRNFTFSDNNLTQHEAHNLLLKLDIPFDHYKKLWTNKEIISLFLPNDLNYKNEDVLIKNGILISGVLTKKHLGTSYNSLIHILWNDYGAKPTASFINKMQTFINHWLLYNCASIGISDTFLDLNTSIEINQIINNTLLEIEELTFNLENNNIKYLEYEINVLNKLNKIRDNTGSKAISNIFNNNRLKHMVSAGSKGSTLNIAQIMSSVGQQSIRNMNGNSGRVDNGFENRTLPHYEKYSLNVESKGFIQHSYLQGLNPQEFFFHSMSGRLGIIDTAIKTSDSGYLQRKLMKIMEDIYVNNGGYIQNANGNIIQYLYGNDCMDASYLENCNLDISLLSNKDFENKYLNTCEEENNKLIKIRNELRNLKDIQESILIPFNIHRILNSSYIDNDILLSNPEEIYEIIKTFIENLKINNYLDYLKPYYIKNIEYVVYSYLNSKNIIKLQFTKNQLHSMLNLIQEKFMRSIVQPGEMVGAIASQSIGEVLTQLTLNTFHSAGISSQTKIIAGIPRFREIINVSKNNSNQMVKTIFNENLSYNSIKKISEKIKYSSLKDFLIKIELLYNKEILTKKYFIEQQVDTPWVIILYLNNKNLYKKGLNSYLIIKSLEDFLISNDINASYGSDNDEEVKIYLKFNIHKENNLHNILKIINNIENNYIQGIDIEDSFIENETIKEIDDAGKIINKTRYYLNILCKNYYNIIDLKYVDPYNTLSNDIYETYSIFGIEATRELIFIEINKLLKNNGIYINSRHIEMICDLITNKTFLLSFDRHGIKKTDAGPLTKASFEETVEQLSKGAIFNQNEHINNVSNNIILGQIGNFGTKYNAVVMDLKNIIN